MGSNICCSDCPSRNHSIFQSIQPGLLNECAKSKNFTRYQPGEYLIKKGDPYNGIYCIKSGTVKIMKPGPEGEPNLILWIARPSDVLGLDALVNNENYTYTAIAIKPVNACFIPEEDFGKLLKKDHVLALNVMKNLSKKINFIEERIQNLTHKTVENRFVEFLVSSAPKRNEGQIYLDHTIDEVAGLVGTTRYYLDKVIGRLRKKNLITVHKRKIMLLDVKKLKELLNPEKPFANEPAYSSLS